MYYMLFWVILIALKQLEVMYGATGQHSRRAEAGKNLRPSCIAQWYSLRVNKLIYLLK